LLALKEAALNLLSIGAAYGVVIALFQWGGAARSGGVPEKVPVERTHRPGGAFLMSVTSQPPASRPPETGRRRRRGLVWVALTLSALIVLAGVGELVARTLIKHTVGSAVAKALNAPVQVAIGSRPVLLDAATGHLSSLTLHSPQLNVCDLIDIDASIHLTDVTRSHGTAHADQVTAAITLSGESLSAAAAKALTSKSPALGAIGIAVTADPGSGEMIMQAGPGGLIRVADRVRLDGTTLRIEPSRTTVAGQPVPDSVINQFLPQGGLAMNLTGLPLGLKPTSVAVTDAGLTLTLHAGRTDLKQPPIDSCADLAAPGRT
jgi:hypothetical protein